MDPVRRKNLSETIQLGAARVLITFFRTLFRVCELFASEQRRLKLRAFRAKMEAMDQGRRSMMEQVKQNPREAFNAIEGFVARYSDFETQQRFHGTSIKVAAMQRESDALQTIRKAAGENVAEAIQGYRNYIAVHPGSYLAYSYLGGALQKTQDWDASLDAYRTAEQLAGDDRAWGASTRLQIGVVLQAQGNPDATIAQFGRIVETEPPENEVAVVAAYLYLGNALNQQGKRKEARQAWKQTVRRDSTKILAAKAQEMLRANR